MRTRMRNNAETYHVWAQRIQDHGEAGSTSFRGPLAYSYGACIGNIINSRTVLLANRRWSVTTSAHQSLAHQAVSHYPVVIFVYNPDVWPGAMAEHRRNLDGLRMDIIEATRKEKHARKAYSREHWGNRILELREYFNNYVALFKLKSLARKEYKGIDNIDVAAIERGIKKAEKERKKAEIEAIHRRKIEVVREYRKWKRGEGGETYNFYQLGFAALRLSSDGKEIETSKGVQIRIRLARRLWAAILKAREIKARITPEIQVDHYRVTEIRPDGELVVGCHTIPYFESRQLARQLNLAFPAGESMKNVKIWGEERGKCE